MRRLEEGRWVEKDAKDGLWGKPKARGPLGGGVGYLLNFCAVDELGRGSRGQFTHWFVLRAHPLGGFRAVLERARWEKAGGQASGG